MPSQQADRLVSLSEVCAWLRHIDRLYEIPGARDSMPEKNPLWDAAEALREAFEGRGQPEVEELRGYVESAARKAWAEIERLKDKAAGAEMWQAQARELAAEVEWLREANDRLSQVLRVIAEAHHGTVTPSKLHAPDDQGFDDCPALTCKAARDALAALQQNETPEEGQR